MKKAKKMLGWLLLMGLNVFGFTAAFIVMFNVLGALDGFGMYLQIAVPLFVGIALMGATYFASIELIDYFFDKNIF